MVCGRIRAIRLGSFIIRSIRGLGRFVRFLIVGSIIREKMTVINKNKPNYLDKNMMNSRSKITLMKSSSSRCSYCFSIINPARKLKW